MTNPFRYRELEVRGTPREMGRQIGEGAREEVRQFCEVALQRVNKFMRVSRASAMQIVMGSIPYAEEYSSEMVEELRGIAEGADVPFEDVMLLQVRNQLQPESDAGCTSLAMALSPVGNIVAQNWENDPLLDEFTIVLTRRPIGKPAVMTVTQAGLIAYIGVNSTGIGLCLNTLPAPARKLGVPHYFTVRGIYESGSLADAVTAVRRAHRAIPANIMLATPQGPADLEVTIDDIHVIRDQESAGIAHTNHCKHPALEATNRQFPELIQSHARDRRMHELIDFRAGKGSSMETIKDALRDHEDYPRSICRHANDDPVTGFWQTVFSVIIETDQRRMHITRGTPCDHPYETYSMC
jgi:isopenicillin-N N-acyltransferase-like protein